MENKEMKKLESLEKYVITPDVRFHGGYVFDGEDIDLCDDTYEDYGKIKKDDGTEEDIKVTEINVKQKIIDSVLITDLTSERITATGRKIKEISHMEFELTKGELLIYIEEQGFVVPKYKMLKIDEAIERLELLKSPEVEEK